MSNESTKTNQITEGVIWKQLLIFFFPIVVGTLFLLLYNTVVAVIVGRFVGKGALAAVGGSSAVLSNLIIGCFTGLASGASVIVSQFYGANKVVPLYIEVDDMTRIERSLKREKEQNNPSVSEVCRR